MNDDTLTAIASAQGRLGPDGVAFIRAGSAAFARGLFNQTPEDSFDVGPLRCEGRYSALVADARIDNRAALIGRLDLPPDVQISDAELACQIFAKEGEGSVDLLRGDFAIAAWSDVDRTLCLARDITGQRPLHYRLFEGGVAFATMPHGLLGIGTETALVDLKEIAKFIADFPRSGSSTFFDGVRRVEPGHIVRIGRDGLESRRYWNPPVRSSGYQPGTPTVAAMRAYLGQATRNRLRGAHRVVGTQLSAGLDSGAVTSTAALELRAVGGEVVAFTSAPSEDFDGPVPRGRIADESDLAGLVASHHANVSSVVVRAEGLSPLDVIRRDAALFGEPMGLPCNQVWWSAIAQSAKEQGVRILLTGEAGNYAFSSGGLDVLHDFLRTAKLLRLAREGINLRRRKVSWRGISYAAFAPWIPRLVWRWLQGIRWGESTASEGRRFLTQDALKLLPSRSAERSGRPSGRRDRRLDLLSQSDPGAFRKGVLAGWGIDERDPTADRDLIEFCVALPPEELLWDGVTRRLSRRALADRMPAEALDAPRGYQGADWYERFSKADVLRMIDGLRQSAEVKRVFDLDALASVASDWPQGNWADGSVISRYRYGLLRSLAAAVFIQQFANGNGRFALRQ